MTDDRRLRRLANWWFGKRRDGFFLFLALLFSGSFITGTMLDGASNRLPALLVKTGFWGFLLTALMALCHLHLYKSHQFLKLFQEMDHLPKKQIGLVSSFSMTVFLSIGFLAMAGLPMVLEPVWRAIAAWFSGFNRPMDFEPVPMEMAEPAPQMPDLSALFGEPEPPPAWTKWLDLALQILGWVLIAGILLFLLRILVRRAWSWVTRPRQFDDDEKIYFTPAFLLPSEKKQEGIRGALHRRLSYSGRIRHHYRREIWNQAKKKKKPPQDWATPQELEQALELEDQTLHQLYEKARYSHEECTEEDWKTIKKAP